MRYPLHALTLLPVLGFASCNFPLPMTVVSIRPMYGWRDGCTSAQVGGHGFDEDARVFLDDQEVLELIQPDAGTTPLDVGFQLSIVTPPKTDNLPGEVDLRVDSGGDTSTAAGAFYYVACPASPYPEALATDSETIQEGAYVAVTGCNLDASLYTVSVGDSERVGLSSVCSTAQVGFAAPARDAGTWFVGFFDAEGTQLFPDPACDITIPVSEYVPPVDPDTSDTAAPYDPCAGALSLTYGGAE